MKIRRSFFRVSTISGILNMLKVQIFMYVYVNLRASLVLDLVPESVFFVRDTVKASLVG